jgi:Domain of unknown function (DUF222)
MITAAQVDAEEELASLCGVLNASYARLVTIVAAALVDESWAIAGVRSPEHWLTMRAGLSPFRAKAIVAVARRRGELPTVMGQFADGQLSLDQVMVVARFTPAHVEASVAELALYASVPQLHRALSHYSFDPPAEPGQTQQVTTFPTGAGDVASGDNATGDNPTADARAGDPQADRAQADRAQAEDTETDRAQADGGVFGDTPTAGGAVFGDTRAGDPPSWNGRALAKTARLYPRSCPCPTTSTAGSRSGSAPQPTSAPWSRPR